MLPESRRLPGRSTPLRRTGAGLRRALEWSLLGLSMSGASWLLTTRVLSTPGEFGPQVPSWTHVALAVHGGLAMVFLVAAGGWLQQHVAPRIPRPSGRASGLFQLAVLALLCVSGYGLYYCASEATRPTWSGTHWIGGLVLLATLLAHPRAARVSRND
jgi:hypothetical protein